LTAQGVSAAEAARVSHLPPVGSLFAAFLGYNPIATLLGPAELSHLPHATAASLTSHSFFPHLIAPAFSRGLTEAFVFAAAVCILGAFASLLRGGKYHYVEEGEHAVGQLDRALEEEDRVPAQEAVADTEPLLVD
jgi:hypothetical protein